MIFAQALDTSEEMKSRIKTMKCVAKNKTIMEFKYCRAKVFSRDSSGIAINITFHQPVTRPFYLKLSMNYKYGTIYRKVVNVPELEMCSVMKNLKTAPPFFKAFLDILGKSIQPLLDGCPYKNEVNFLAQFDDDKWPSVFPSGMYRIDCIFRVPETVVMLAYLEFEIVSGIKSSF